MVQLASQIPVHAVSGMMNVSNYKLRLLLERYVHAAREHLDCSDVTDIGVDETSLKRGHSSMALIVDLKRKRTLEVTSGRDASTIEPFCTDLREHKGSPEAIGHVSAEMSAAFARGVSEHLPTMDLTFDRFHVLKLVNEAVNTWKSRTLPSLRRSAICS